MFLKLSVSLGFAVVLVVMPSQTAHAYLDPGTGSIILQAILGGAAGAMIAGKLYWSKIKSFFGLAGVESDATRDLGLEESDR